MKNGAAPLCSRMYPLVLADVPHGVIVDRVGVVERLGLVFRVRVGRDHRVVARQRVGVEEAARSVDRAVEAVVPALQGPIVLGPVGLGLFRDVPLAGHVGRVARALEGLGDGDAAAVEVAAVSVEPAVVHHMPDAGLVRVEPAHEARASRAAAGGVVEVREPQPVGGQTVEARRVDLTAVAPDVRVTHVIRHDQDDVGLLGGRCGCTICPHPHSCRTDTHRLEELASLHGFFLPGLVA